MLHGDEMRNNGSKMHKNLEQQLDKIQNQELSLSMMDMDILLTMDTSV
jgi:hypothetical protein